MVYSEKQVRPKQMHPKLTAGRAIRTDGTRVDTRCQSGGAIAVGAAVFLPVPQGSLFTDISTPPPPRQIHPSQRHGNVSGLTW